MDPKFYEAWFNADHVVLGRRLRPFSLGSAMVLSLSDSPFLLGTAPGVDYGLTDLQLAVLVCSTPTQFFFDTRLSSSWWKRLRRILWTRKCKRLNFREECQKFVTYIDDYYSPPSTWLDDGDSGDGKLGAPWVLCNATFLMRNTTMSEERVWSMPLGQALWYAATISEQLGAKIQLLSEEERKALEAMGVEV